MKLDGANNVAREEIIRREVTPEPPTVEKLDAFTSWLMGAKVRADCFFVTTARLLDTTVQDISNRTGIEVPEPGTSGVSLENIVNALTRLGLRFRTWGSQGTDEGRRHTAGGPTINRPNRVGLPHYWAFPGRNIPRTMGVAYIRPDGSGHVVVARLVYYVTIFLCR